MMVDSMKLEPVIQYSDPDYNLTFYDVDGAEVYLGISENHLQHLKELIILCGELRE